LTSDYEQAKKWALRTAKNRDVGIPTVSHFKFDQKNLKIYEENSKIVIEMFFKVKENITSYLEIRTDLENLEDKEER